MHPAPSVILFTVASGLGFGLMVWLGLGLPDVTGWAAFGLYFVAYALAVGGLGASAFHLGRPERALKAFTQWRTSWLSREAWVACAALIGTAPFAIGQIFLGGGWAVLGWLSAVLCVGVVAVTSMIYAQLRSVPRWHHGLTPALFLSVSLAGGALLAGQVSWAILLLALAGLVQMAAFWRGDRALAASGTGIGTATGLGGGTIRQFEPPHTGRNYLLDEMVFVVGRARSQQLRAITLSLGYTLPIFLLILPLGLPGLILAIASHVAGMLAARWLFFAEAEHVVGLYYGKRAA